MEPIGENEHGDLKVILLGVVVEHVLRNVEVVVQYEIVNSYVPSMGIQADWHRTSGQLRARRVLFSLHDLEINFTVPGGSVTSEWCSRIAPF